MVLQIGKLKIGPGPVLAPMAGITNQPFRLLAREQGCPLVYSEMISAKGMLMNGRRNSLLLRFSEQERPIGFQLFGSDPRVMAEAASRIEAHGADFIDLNMGCPTRKITRNGDGGALMRDPQLCGKIFSAVVSAVSCPVTVKIRRGWGEQETNAVEIASRAQDNGISALTVHGRTIEQGYSGKADWEIIRQVREAVTIPVIGNGDIDSPEAAEKMLQSCGCDAVMIGRAARGNPWIFKATLCHLNGEVPPEPPSPEDIIKMALKHFRLLIDFKGEALAAREMRRHAAWYLKGFPGAAATRQRLLTISCYGEAEEIFNNFLRLAAPGYADCHKEM